MGGLVSSVFGNPNAAQAQQDTSAATSAFQQANAPLSQFGSTFSQDFGPVMNAVLSNSGLTNGNTAALTGQIANTNTEGTVAPALQATEAGIQHSGVDSGFAGPNSWTPSESAQAGQQAASAAAQQYETAGQDVYGRQQQALGDVTNAGTTAATGSINEGQAYLGGAATQLQQGNIQQSNMINGITSIAGLFGTGGLSGAGAAAGAGSNPATMSNGGLGVLL